MFGYNRWDLNPRPALPPGRSNQLSYGALLPFEHCLGIQTCEFAVGDGFEPHPATELLRRATVTLSNNIIDYVTLRGFEPPRP